MSGGGDGGDSGERHVGALNLRRLCAGEWRGAELARAMAHVAGCPECERRLALLTQEQRDFEIQVSFERFSAGVERATRVPRPAGGARGRSRTRGSVAGSGGRRPGAGGGRADAPSGVTPRR